MSILVTEDPELIAALKSGKKQVSLRCESCQFLFFEKLISSHYKKSFSFFKIIILLYSLRWCDQNLLSPQHESSRCVMMETAMAMFLQHLCWRHIEHKSWHSRYRVGEFIRNVNDVMIEYFWQEVQFFSVRVYNYKIGACLNLVYICCYIHIIYSAPSFSPPLLRFLCSSFCMISV